MNSDKSSEASAPAGEICRILSLDGGGAKGFYTLGVLKELEAMLKATHGRALHESFRLIFGTSTGAIIAALVALGYSVEEILALYKEHVPTIMRHRFPSHRSASLTKLAQTVFGGRTFADVKTDVGIVATHWRQEKPMIFKSSIAQAHGLHGSFVPGFGCTIADAVRASCSAYPFFDRTTLATNKGEHVELFDGGYCANNPTLYAIADATAALHVVHSNIRVVSVGVGKYPEPKSWSKWFARRFMPVRLLQKTLNVNTLSMEQLRTILFKDIPTVRISDTFAEPEMATDLLEHDLKKLDMLYQRGVESYGKHEEALKTLFAGSV
jgi:uncharacterized protein